MLGTINWHLTAVLLAVVERAAARSSRWLGGAWPRAASKFRGPGRTRERRHHRFVSNIGLVRAFGAAQREQQRLEHEIEDEMQAQRLSLRSLERLRQFHAITVFFVTAGVLVWSVELWRRGADLRRATWCSPPRWVSPCCTRRAISPWRWSTWCSNSRNSREAVQVLGLPHEMQDADGCATAAIVGGADRLPAA